jgi:1,4-alpha-glucan branching enzyme
MSLTKRNLKTRPVTKVTFRLPASAVMDADAVHLVGDFNAWNPQATPMERLKNGDRKVTLDLERGREYQFRYLIDGRIWENDSDADRYIPSGVGNADNSVVVV